MAPQTRSSAREGTRLVVEEESRELSILPPSSEQGEDGMMSDFEDSETETPKPRSGKRARKDFRDSEASIQPPVKRARGKQGKLKGLMNMPIEVFTEISKYLYPLDLILLSRANKFFRELLMRRSAIQTWRYALSNVPGLPPCPKELCEPQYAALVFSKYCSMCGKQALRPMDPILQVRLCVPCRDQETAFPGNDQYGVVSTSSTLLPQKGRYSRWCCLRKDLDAYHKDYDAVRQADGYEAAYRWKQKRRQEVNTRWENAKPLVEFIKQMEAEQSDDLTTRKMQRQQEIESRLLNLDWEEGDFNMREKAGTKQWKSLVCIAKPLTERDWDKILPQLTSLLEHNRKLRLEEETLGRQISRRTKTLQWLSKTLRGLEPYAQVLDSPIGDDTKSSTSNPQFTQAQEEFYSVIRYSEESQSNSKKLKAPYPSFDQAMAWNPFQLLVDTDVSMEDFELALDDMRPTLDSLLLKWREELEECLVKLLPPDDDPTEGDDHKTSGLGKGVACGLNSEPTILVDGAPINSLPSEKQRLLRADVVFGRIYGFYYYSDDFTHLWSGISDASKWNYHVEASKIAKAFLATLGYKDATYLQMKAVGPGFSCGRCVGRNCVTWRDLLSHYINEYERLGIFQKHHLFKSGQIAYVFTHDIEAAQDDKPLVRLADGDDMKRPHRSIWGRASCLVCAPVTSVNFDVECDVADHVRNVHSIQDPKKDEHYRAW